MDIDQFISGVDVRRTGLKEAIARYVLAKGESTGDGSVSLVEILNLQTAYVDKLRLELFKEA